LNLEDWRFRERAARAQPFRLFWAGRLVPKKGVDLLLDALAQLRHRQWRLRIVGDGPEKTHCLERARELRIGDRVSWEAPQEPREIRHAMTEADALVLPARVAPDGDRDGIPNVALEAMASGLPVVATTTGGLQDVVSESTAWPANSATAADFATALETFFAASDDEVRARTGEARSQIQTRFDIRQTVRARLDLLSTHLRNAV
jgi:glycosyltransferase involved in cell wall biosynthesis